MNISKRIETIVNYIKYNAIADIGTDHGYISIYAKKNKDTSKIIACDVNKEPLENCINNLKKHKLENEIETRLSNGIEKIKQNEVDTIIIAGMGGNLIIDILKNNVDVTKSTKQLVLQPQSNCSKVRKFIHEIGFSIKDETILFEDEQFYFIFNCFNVEEEKYDEEQYRYGKILVEEKNQLLKIFLEKEMQKEINIKNDIIKKSKTNVEKKLTEKDFIINSLKNTIAKLYVATKIKNNE